MTTCEFYKTGQYNTCINIDWHHNGTYTCSCNGDKSCTFYNPDTLNHLDIIEIVQCPLHNTHTHIDNCRWCDHFKGIHVYKVYCDYH